MTASKTSVGGNTFVTQPSLKGYKKKKTTKKKRKTKRK